MPYPTAKITVDHLAAPEAGALGGSLGNRVGMLLHYPEGQQAEESLHIRWRTLDDDGEKCYEGLANSDGLELAFDWSQTDVGSTLLQVWEPEPGTDGAPRWRDCIG